MPEEFKYFSGWEEIRDRINITLSDIEESKKVVVIECYHGTDQKELQKHSIALYYSIDLMHHPS